MSGSPIIFTYKYPGDQVLENYLQNRESSPLPGLSFIGVYKLKSENIHLPGVTLTLQTYSNNVTPPIGDTSFLQIGNVTIIASYGSNTIGTLSWQQQIENPLSVLDPSLTTTRIGKVSSNVSSASGIFSSFLFGNVIRQFDNNTKERKIIIYASE